MNFVTLNVVFGAEEPRAKRVLMLSTGSRFSVGFPTLEQNAIEKLRQLHPRELEFYSEYLDIIRFPSEKHHRILRDYLRHKYADDIPDLIVLFYAGNLRVAQSALAELFPTTPVVVAGLTEEDLPAGSLSDRATGVAQRADADGTIKLILQLQPDIQRIVVIGGTTEVDRGVISRVMRGAHSFADKVQFELWNNQSMAEILEAVKRLPPKTAILFTRMFRDGAGRAVISASAAQAIGKVSNVPVYAFTDVTFGTGVVGGSVSDVARLGQRAGELAHRVLSGADPKSIPLEVVTQGTPIFDWRALQRWGIIESRLPPNSIVRFRPPSMWDQYHWYIIGTFAVVLIQTLLIAGLLLHRARRRRAEASLRESQEFMELSTSAGELGLWARDLDKNELWTNPRLRSLFGFSQNDVLQLKDLIGRINADDRTQVIVDVERAQRTGVSFQGEFRVMIPGAGERWVAARGRAVDENGHDGARKRRMGVVFDITDRKRAEEGLRESEARFRTMADSAPVMIWMSGTDKLCSFFNKGWLDFTGRNLEQELGNGWAEGVHEEDFDRCLEIYTKAFDARQEFTMEYRLRRYDGEYRWIFDNGVPRLESDGTFVGYIGSCIDITERKRGEEKFRLAVEASPSAIVMINPRGQIVLVNRLTEKLFGYCREELIGQSVETLVPDRFRGDHPSHRKAFFEAPQTRAMGAGRDLFARRKDGSEFQVEIGLNPIETHEGTLILTAIIDITERKQAEKNLTSALEEIRGLKERLEEENIYLKEEISEVKGFEEIVGKSDALKYVLTRVEQVAKTDATVLLQGETGVGKELIARAIHEKSSRSNGPYVKVNCATLPEALVESELFGHERGAFTGADRQRKGRFELADGGTILLDEIGELPAGTQVKLLRVLQEGEFERVGGSNTIKVNVRVIAATNRKLHDEVSAGRFRHDLFYRINVYPITIPPLRQRVQDIPLLVSHFARQIGERLGKSINEVPAQVIHEFTEYTWPGNIRELQNVIERAVIVSSDGVLRLPEPLVQATSRPASEDKTASDSTIVSSMDEAEREHILRALEITGWRINGPKGAAAMLKLHPSTLRFRIKKLGLTKVSGYTSAQKSNLH